jgi:MOSC domain-containing protein YiiM
VRGLWKGVVVSIHIAPSATKPTVALSKVTAIAGKGLEGDRYFLRAGTFSKKPGGGRQITLIESEAIEALQRDHGIKLDPGATRRNIVTRGVPLNHLVGKRFVVGDATLLGTGLCEPCSYLEGLTEKGVLKGLIHRGGLRADVLNGGTIKVGDTLQEENGSRPD